MAATCVHINAAELRPPGPNQSVYREDCTQCFDSIDSPSGLDVCLYCFNGGCLDERNHATLHYETSKHPLSLNIKRKRKHTARDEPPQKLTKLEIQAETESDRYDYQTRVDCRECGIQDVDKNAGKLSEMVEGVMKANTFATQAEVAAWQQEIEACEHTVCLEQGPGRQIASQDLGQCAKCDLKENLWLCLACGNLGCGRPQFGGSGGNGHAREHGAESHHPVAVKLGSLTADGTADIYCYTCDDDRMDPELPAHLSHWGINIADRQKTEKSLTEMQIEQNMKWEFSMTDEQGNEMKPLYGPGLTGLKNLGNSCYMNSILQCLYDLPEFQQRYFVSGNNPPPSAARPADDVETQLRKVADGLLSGRYSKPDPDVVASDDHPIYQRGLAPAMLKHLIGKGHAEFSTMRQQDAFEFLLHLLSNISKSQPPDATSNPVDVFKFAVEQRLQCSSCKRVRYKTDEMENITVPVPARKLERDAKMTDVNGSGTGDQIQKDEYEAITFKECLDIFTGLERVDLTCPSCNGKEFTKQSLFQTFPQVLAVSCARFALVNWVPTKIDVPVIVDEKPISFDAYKSQGHQEGEELLPDDVGQASKPQFVPNELALSQLEAMGFPRVRCEKALKATGNSDAETASLWLFEHMEDPDIDEPMQEDTAATSNSSVDQSKIEDLGNMGFEAPQARQALKETGGNMEAAVEWLFSNPDAPGDFGEDAPSASAGSAAVEKRLFGSDKLPAAFQLQSIVCHKGASIHAGHYVAFIRKQTSDGTSWVLFNDEKVVEATDVEEMKKFAYVYFFRRT